MGDVQLVADVDGSLFLGIVADDDEVIAYACDGTPDGSTVYAWFAGSNKDGTFEIYGDDMSVLRGTFDGGEASGTLTIGGADLTFTARAASGDAGTWLAVDDEYKGGWVVIDGDDRGAVINRTTTDLITGSRFDASGVTVNGITLVPSQMQAPNDFL